MALLAHHQLCLSKYAQLPCNPPKKKLLLHGSARPVRLLTVSCYSPAQTLQSMEEGALGDDPDERSLRNVSHLDVHRLMAAARSVRDRASPSSSSNILTFSPKVFIPLTRACRDTCGYCTFAQGPSPGQPVFMSVEEVLQIARQGVVAGCTEALFTLGEKPEFRYLGARKELAALGFSTTVEYLAEVSKIVLEETGLLPHINAGNMSRAEISSLRRVSVSQGLMLESVSEKLLEPGAAHYNCPDKVPATRIATVAAAGEEKVPFTSGLLVGIGESREDRLDTLFALRSLHRQYGHLQEVIIQNFRAKKGTRMVAYPEPSIEELQWTIAMARLVFGSSMSIQAPPNLTPKLDDFANGAEWTALIQAGINDWGGISPITKDWVNPEAPWPHLALLAASTLDAGKYLLPRLPVYPMFIKNASTWIDPAVLKTVLAHANSLGYARGEPWSPGVSSGHQLSPQDLYGWRTNSDYERIQFSPKMLEVDVENGNARKGEIPVKMGMKDELKADISVTVNGTLVLPYLSHLRAPKNKEVEEILMAAKSGDDLSEIQITKLFHSVGAAFEEICAAADELRSLVNGDKVTFVINRNINYTNVCSYKCTFCAFSKGKANEALRGKPYRLSLEEIAQRVKEAWDRGATEVCMQGGIHPDYTGETYLEILQVVKQTTPMMHVHAFSPLEVFQGASTLGISVEEFLLELKKAGLGSLPGTAAEILDDEVRKVLCPGKLNTKQWLEVMETAHKIGLRSTSTIMFGHIDSPNHWAKHLLHIRNLQKRTGGFTEFVPLPFVHMEAPLFLAGKCRKGPTRRECILMHAVSRLVLHPVIPNIQASWVKLGPTGAQALLMAGCNDMGGSLMNESITRAAGASHGQELLPEDIQRLILSIGRVPEERTTLYKKAPIKQKTSSFCNA